MTDLSKFIIEAPMFSVRAAIAENTLEVNEYTMRNLQLQVAVGLIEPFWFFTNEQRWALCRSDGCLPTEAYSSQFVKDTNDFTSADSGMGLNDDLAIKLFRARQATMPKFIPRSERK